jgi:hypothetical protein
MKKTYYTLKSTQAIYGRFETRTEAAYQLAQLKELQKIPGHPAANLIVPEITETTVHPSYFTTPTKTA